MCHLVITPGHARRGAGYSGGFGLQRSGSPTRALDGTHFRKGRGGAARELVDRTPPSPATRPRTSTGSPCNLAGAAGSYLSYGAARPSPRDRDGGSIGGGVCAVKLLLACRTRPPPFSRPGAPLMGGPEEEGEETGGDESDTRNRGSPVECPVRRICLCMSASFQQVAFGGTSGDLGTYLG